MRRQKFGAARGLAHRSLRVEHLESRAMLAGNVNVDVEGDTLFIRGNNSSNHIQITQSGPDTYVVTGVNDTDINGDDDEFIAEDIRHINIDLKKGNDSVTIGTTFDPAAGGLDGLDTLDPVNDFSLDGNLLIKMREGKDEVAVSADVGGILRIDTGDQNDTVLVSNSNVDDDLLILTFDGHDDVVVEGTVVGDLLLIDSDDGEDTATVIGSVAGHAIIDLGDDEDVVNIDGLLLDSDRDGIYHKLLVVTGRDDDEVNVTAVDGDQVEINTGNDDDEANVAEITVNDDFVLLTGSGRDRLRVDTIEARTAVVNSGSDRDRLTLANFVVDNDVVVVTGSGNDRLTASNFEVDNNAVFDAGSGEDEFVLDAILVDEVLTVVMGSDDDILTISGSSANEANLIGGSGKDTYFDGGNDFDEENEDFERDRTL